MSTAILATRKLLQQRDPRVLLALALGGVAIFFLLQTALSGAASAQALRPALLATLFTALATGAGALPVLFVGQVSMRTHSAMLGFGAGVMLAAAAFSLAVPALSLSSPTVVALGILLGAGVMLAIDRFLPHAHADQPTRRPYAMARVWLVVFAIALHNVPEGLAVGVAYAGGGAPGTAVTLGIGIQTLAEGLVVAWAMLALGYGRARSAVVALATGLMEPIGALLGVAMIGVSAALLPWGLAFAAGAMIFVVSHEIIPESHRLGHQSHATAGVTAGFAIMLLLNGALA